MAALSALLVVAVWNMLREVATEHAFECRGVKISLTNRRK